jgi:hypothetical protein
MEEERWAVGIVVFVRAHAHLHARAHVNVCGQASEGWSEQIILELRSELRACLTPRSPIPT